MSLAFERVTDGTHVVQYDRRHGAQTHGIDRTVAVYNSNGAPDAD